MNFRTKEERQKVAEILKAEGCKFSSRKKYLDYIMGENSWLKKQIPDTTLQDVKNMISAYRRKYRQWWYGDNRLFFYEYGADKSQGYGFIDDFLGKEPSVYGCC